LPVNPGAAAVLCVSFCLFSVACSHSSQRGVEPETAPLKPAGERRPAPNFTLKDSAGRPVQLSDYRGKVVLLNFWATWCGPCQIEIPWFIEFEKRHRDQGFAVLGVSMDEEGWEAVRPFAERLGINYRILLGTEIVAQQYGGVDSLPTTFLIDREGRIAATHVGLTDRKEFEDGIQVLLAGR